MLAQGRCPQARTREAPGDPHDSRESDLEAREGARGAVRGPRPGDPGGARGRAAGGVRDNSWFVKASYFSVWLRLSPAILGGIGGYAWLAMPRETSRDHEGVENRGPVIDWTPPCRCASGAAPPDAEAGHGDRRHRRETSWRRRHRNRSRGVLRREVRRGHDRLARRAIRGCPESGRPVLRRGHPL